MSDEEREVEMVAGGAPMPWWGWAIVAVFVVLGGLFVWAVVAEGDADRARAAAEGWSVVGSPPTSAGGATVWSKCDGSTRLYLTMGADGFAVGPAVPIPGGCR